MLKTTNLFFKPILITASFVLTACGGGSSGSDPAPIEIPIEQQQPLSTKYTGTWEINTDAIIMVSQSSITTFALDPLQGCYEVGFFNIISSTENSISSIDIETGDVATTSFALEEEVLKVTELVETLEFVRSQEQLIPQACPNKNALNSVEVTMTLDYLPPVFMLNRDAQTTGRPEYLFQVHFDLNQNSVEDNGDVYMQLFHFKGSGNYEDNQQVGIEDIGADLWSLFPGANSDRFGSVSSSQYGPINLQRNENSLVFKFNTTQLAQLSHLSAQTPVKISTAIFYPQPESDVIEGWQDGPWNWSSETHQDTYPDSGFISPDQNANHLDGRADLSEGESQWVDIREVSFDFR
jgi:hypothetical protein